MDEIHVAAKDMAHQGAYRCLVAQKVWMDAEMNKVRWSEKQKVAFRARWMVLREEQNLTHVVLAELLGITKQTSINIEKGYHVPSEVVVLKFAALEERYGKGGVEGVKLAWVPSLREEK